MRGVALGPARADVNGANGVSVTDVMRMHPFVMMSLLTVACDSSPPAPIPSPEPPVTTPSASVSAASVVKARALESIFRSYRFDSGAMVFPGGEVAIVCEDGCRVPEEGKPPRTWRVAVDGKTPDETLWPANAFHDPIHRLKENPEDPKERGRLPAFEMHGRYPDALFARIIGERVGHRLPDPLGFLQAKYHRKYWGLEDKPTAHARKPQPTLPAKVKHALASSPITSPNPDKALVHGANAPVMAIEERKLHLYDAGKWSTRTAAWTSLQGHARLADGSTLVVASHAAYRVAKDGEIHETAKPEVGGALRMLELGPRIALVEKGSEVVVFMPMKDSFVPPPTAVASAPAPAEPAPKAPAPDAPDADPAAPRSSSAVAGAKPPRITGFSSRCKAPFVVIATPPQANWRYSATAHALKGLEPTIGEALTFVEIAGDVVVFGAVARDEEAARALLKELETRIPKAEPRLECFVPIDTSALPPSVQWIRIHLPSGTLLSD
jgi:hypothetical protein